MLPHRKETCPYQVIGVDFAGPLAYRLARQREGKAYLLLYACSLTRGIYLDLLPSLEGDECIRSLKKFIARRGRPERIYSDNGRTFVAAAKWIRIIMKDEKLQDYLSVNQIKWQFNLSRAPWCTRHGITHNSCAFLEKIFSFRDPRDEFERGVRGKRCVRACQ